MAATLGWTPEAGSAVICVIVVMKTVISYTDNSLRPGGNELKSVRAQSEAEGKNVLLKYAWHDTSKGIETTNGIAADAVRRLQEEVYMQLMNPKGQWAQAVSKGVTFEGLMESEPMLEHFWSRLELRMQIGLEVEQNLKYDWMPVQPVMKAGRTTPLSAADLAEQGLVRWSSGNEILAERLLHNPARFDEQGRVFRQVRGWSFGIQKCIRVLYDSATKLDGPGFRNLVEVIFAPQTLETGQQGARWTDGDAQIFRLVAVARLGTPEYLRIYDKAGVYDVPRDLSSESVLCLNNDWKLGQTGFKYMLYYVRANSTDLGVGSAQERPPSNMSMTNDLRAAVIQQPSFPLQSISWIPTPTSRAGMPGPRLTNMNLIPLKRSRAGRFGEESPAGPSGQPGGTTSQQQRQDLRRRADEPSGPDSMGADTWYVKGSSYGPRRKKRRLDQDDMEM